MPARSQKLRFLACCVATLALVAALPHSAVGCPTCSDSLAENDASGGSLGAAISYSVMFMIAVPYLILGTFCTFAYRSVKRAAAEREAQARETPALAATPVR